MRIVIIRATVAGGVPCDVDQVVDVPETEAKFLIGIGKAKEYQVASRSKMIETADQPMENVETADAKGPRKRVAPVGKS